MKIDAGADVAIRAYRDTDEARVLKLLEASLGSGPTGARRPAFFRWKHFENPFGDSLMLLAETHDQVVGLRAFMRWRFTSGDRELTAVRAVDTATHPQFQGHGIFSRLTLTAIEALRGHADVVFNTPNDKSLPGYLKMGWRIVGSVPIRVRVRRPIRFARRARWLRQGSPTGAGPPPAVTAPPASEALRDAEGLSLVLEQRESFPGRLWTPLSFGYLQWRYGTVPLLDYHAIGSADAVAIFRVRRRGALWETTVSELIVPDGEVRAARRALRTVVRVADTDHLTLSFPPGSTADRAVQRSTFRAPRGMTLIANPLAADLDPDPALLSSWALSLGDLEVF